MSIARLVRSVRTDHVFGRLENAPLLAIELAADWMKPPSIQATGTNAKYRSYLWNNIFFWTRMVQGLMEFHLWDYMARFVFASSLYKRNPLKQFPIETRTKYIGFVVNNGTINLLETQMLTKSHFAQCELNNNCLMLFWM